MRVETAENVDGEGTKTTRLMLDGPDDWRLNEEAFMAAFEAACDVEPEEDAVYLEIKIVTRKRA